MFPLTALGSLSITERSQGRNSEQDLGTGTEAEAMEEDGVLACFPMGFSACFLTAPRTTLCIAHRQSVTRKIHYSLACSPP